MDLLLIFIFLNVLLIRLVWDPMAPAITQWRIIIDAAHLILQMEIRIDCQIK